MNPVAPTEPAPSSAAVPQELARIVQRGSAALQAGDILVALDLFTQVVQAFPHRPEGHNNLGALYSALGEAAKAEECFDRVLDLLPGNSNVLYNRGLVRARQERFAAARADFEAVLGRDPLDPETHNNLGVLDFRQGEQAAARLHFEAALRHRPDYPGALVNLCDLLCEVGDADGAVQLCRNYLAARRDAGVRRKLLGLQIQGLRQGLQEACGNAESLVQEAEGDLAARQDLGRLIRAQAALTPDPV